MADSGLFIGWNAPVRGREQQALESFNEAIAYFSRLQEEGAIESLEPVFLEPHGGDLGGFILLRGDAEQLASLRVSEEFGDVIMQASLCVDGMGVVGATLAERLQRNMAVYSEKIGAFV